MSNKTQIDRLFPSSLELLQKIDQKPSFCECARVLSRPLQGGESVFLNSITRDSETFDQFNLKASHEHIVWEQSKDNIGFKGADNELGIWPFTAKGEVFSESLNGRSYESIDKKCYDGEIMRESVAEVGEPKSYRIFGFNCQEYIQKIKEKYQTILTAF